MISILGEKIDMSQLELGDIIDVNVLQNFLDNFAVGFNCAAVSVGRRGEEFTKPSHYRPFCSNFVHSSTIGDHRCATCHNEFGRKAIAQNRPYVGYCHAGLVDFAAPVIIHGEHLGTVLGGQILDKPMEEEAVRKVAEEIGVSGDGLAEAARQIDIVPMGTVESAAEVLYIVVNALAASGFNRIETNVLTSQLAANFIQISDTIESLATDAQSITGKQSELMTEIKSVNALISKITTILNSISKIADQTKILGINSSVEAARLGNGGKTFAVLAEEIRSLSESTKRTVAQINTINKEVNESVTTTLEMAQTTMGTTSNQSASMEELFATVQRSVALAERLKNLS